MINAKELRIGNWVTYHGEEDMPTAIDGTDIVSIETRKEYAQKHSPTPITHDILEKAGLKKDGDCFYKEITVDGWRIELEQTDQWDVYLRTGDGDGIILCSIDSVHEFQNVWFAITKEEIEINL